MKLWHLFEGVAEVILKVTLLSFRSTLLVCLLLDSNIMQLTSTIS